MGELVSTTYGTAGQMVTAAKSANADGIYINATTVATSSRQPPHAASLIPPVAPSIP